MVTKINKWGNSLAVRIPATVAQDLGLDEHSQVSISVEDGGIVLRPIKKPTLDELLAHVTPENQHDATDWGEPVGKEIW